MTNPYYTASGAPIASGIQFESQCVENKAIEAGFDAVAGAIGGSGVTSVTAIVPNNYYYRCTGITLGTWAELR